MPAALRALAESGIFEYNPATEVNFFIAADTAPDSGNPRRRKASPSSRAAAENCSRQAVRRRQDEPGPGSSSRSSTQLQQNAARLGYDCDRLPKLVGQFTYCGQAVTAA